MELWILHLLLSCVPVFRVHFTPLDPTQRNKTVLSRLVERCESVINAAAPKIEFHLCFVRTIDSVDDITLVIDRTSNDWQVSDVNDHRPQFERDEYSADLVENNYIGAIILTVCLQENLCSPCSKPFLKLNLVLYYLFRAPEMVKFLHNFWLKTVTHTYYYLVFHHPLTLLFQA